MMQRPPIYPFLAVTFSDHIHHGLRKAALWTPPVYIRLRGPWLHEAGCET